MAQAQGSLARISFVEEVTYGTTPGSPAMKLLKAATYGAKADAILEEIKSNAINASRAVDSMRIGNMSAKLSIPFELPVRGLTALLKHVMGSNTDAGSGPSAYTHTMKRGALPVGLAIEVGYTDIAQYFMYNGCKIDKMALSIKPNGLATGTLDLIAQKVTQATSTAGAPTALVHLPFAEFECVTLEGGGAIKLQNMNITITNGLSSQPVVGSRYINGLVEGKGECTGDITYLFQDATIYAKWLAETASTLKATYTNASLSIDFNMPAVKYFDNGTPGIPTDKGIVMAQKFRAVLDSGTSSDIVITVTNDEATA